MSALLSVLGTGCFMFMAWMVHGAARMSSRWMPWPLDWVLTGWCVFGAICCAIYGVTR